VELPLQKKKVVSFQAIKKEKGSNPLLFFLLKDLPKKKPLERISLEVFESLKKVKAYARYLRFNFDIDPCSHR
jgi:hypothetical protein